jgi:nucleotidyltransferase/DNA polymerase involved in DNA repair
MALRLCPQAKVMKGDMELYSKLSHDITQVIEEAPIVEKASIDEFYLDITEWIGFMAVTSGQMNFHNQLQRNRIAAKFCAIC